MIISLWGHLSIRRKKQFLLLIPLMLLASLAEMASIGAIIPFLGVLTSPETIYQYQLIQPLIQFLEIENSSQLLLPLTLIFVFIVFLSSVIRILMLYAITKLSFATGTDLSVNIYRRTLYQDYSVHISRNSSEVINSIVTKTNTVINNIIGPILYLISSVIMMVGIMIALITVDTITALLAFTGFGLLYWGVVQKTKARIMVNGQNIAVQSTLMVKALQEGLGGIRDVLIDGTQELNCRIYSEADLSFRRASGDNQFIGSSLRYAIEGIGMALIAALAYFLTQQNGGVVAVIPVLGALALGAQRLLPALQQSYYSYSTIKGSKPSFLDVLSLLDQPIPDYAHESSPEPIAFKKSIELKKISFRYGDELPWVLKNIDLDIPKGSSVGFMGATGNGKSTLIDIIMGLLLPTEGKLTIDGKILNKKNFRAWQSRIAHVPQNIYLSDSTIEENIAFRISKDKINHKQDKIAAQQAQISDVIDEFKNGYQTYVGERGIRLSGGQRQRIGIARALYKKADVLIFDEGTSALDNETERAVMKSIENLEKDLTIIIIAHRLSTLPGCDRIVKLGKNNLLNVGTFDEMTNSKYEK